MNESAAGVRLRQGHTWVGRLAELEGWPQQRQREADRLLDSCPAAELDCVVEDFRARMWAAMERTGSVPRFVRMAAAGAKPAPTIDRKLRGLARHLYRGGSRPGPAEHSEPETCARARDPPPIAVYAADEDPYGIRCCESCTHWCRHPESGAGLCMAEPGTPDCIVLRRAWLGAGNALNRCAHFLRRRAVP
nr:hypothetical protein [Cupriavidus taiwanensis]